MQQKYISYQMHNSWNKQNNMPVQHAAFKTTCTNILWEGRFYVQIKVIITWSNNFENWNVHDKTISVFTLVSEGTAVQKHRLDLCLQ